MSDFTRSLLAFTYGTTNLDLLTYKLDTTAVTQPALGRTGTKVKITADCELRSDTPAALAAALLAVYTDLSTDARSLEITGLTGVRELFIDAALCQHGGPWISFATEDSSSPCCKKFKVTVEAESIAADLTATPKDSYKVQLKERPDNLKAITRSGVINGYGAQTYLLNAVVPQIDNQYPWPNWVRDVQVEASQDSQQTQVTYSITVTENFSPLPRNGETKAASGTITTQRDRDEHYRITTTIGFNLLVVGDPMALLSKLRPTGDPQPIILRESYQITSITEQRLSGVFVILSSASNDQRLMDWSEEIRFHDSTTVWEEHTFIGGDPVLVQKAKTTPRLHQRGSASAIGGYRKAPEPLLADLAAIPDVGYVQVSDAEFKSDWQYEMFIRGDAQGALTTAFGAISRAAATGGIYIGASGFDLGGDDG